MRFCALLGFSFKLLCFCTTAFMVGFWIYKYQENEDVTVIEYKSLDKEINFTYPEVTLCFATPKFRNEDINFTREPEFTQRYTNYLKGAEMNETYK